MSSKLCRAAQSLVFKFTSYVRIKFIFRECNLSGYYRKFRILWSSFNVWQYKYSFRMRTPHFYDKTNLFLWPIHDILFFIEYIWNSYRKIYYFIWMICIPTQSTRNFLAVEIGPRCLSSLLNCRPCCNVSELSHHLFVPHSPHNSTFS